MDIGSSIRSTGDGRAYCITDAINEAFNTKELIKINVLKNCADEPKDISFIRAERTHSTVVQVIGRKIVLYKRNNENIKIYFPGEKKVNDKRK